MPVRPSEILSLTNEAAVLTRRGRVIFANPRACALLGDDCVGQTVRQLFGDATAEVQAGSFVSGLAVNGADCILRVSPTEDGKVYFLSPRLPDRELLSDSVLYALRSSLSSFALAAEEARELCDGIADSRASACLSMMTHRYFKINRLVSNVSVVLDATRGRLHRSCRDFDLARLCRDTVDTLNLLLPGEKIVFSYGGSLPVHADPALVEQLLGNLLMNCILHAKGHTRIRIGLMETEDSAILSVVDDGCGIEADQLPAVFEKYRCAAAPSRIGLGSGFGLGAALSIAVAHGGTLLLESRVGTGTSVRASLNKDGAKQLGGGAGYTPDMHRFLTCFADCLEDGCFSEKYLD